MKFKGTIIITDPCYIIKDEDKGHIDFSCDGSMKTLGVSHYISGSTIYGDWSCTTFQTTNDPYYNLEAFEDALDSNEYVEIDCPKLGEFCADGGMVGVFDLDEVRKYNPSIDKWIAAHRWCVTTITGFDGEANYYIDRQGNAHIVGIGNINFFTTQTGL